MKRVFISLLATLLSAGAIAACSGVNQSSDKTPASSLNNLNQPQNNSNKNQASYLLGLFLVKKDNQTGEYKGQLFPIALHLNGKYVDVSQDVTTEIRNDFAIANLIRNQETKSFLNAIQQFTVIHQSKPVGQFTVNKLEVAPFACSAFMVGQGTFSGEQSLQTLFSTLPDTQSGSFSGKLGDQQVDETWRWTLASSQYQPSANSKSTPTDATQYQQDLIAAATPLLAQSEKSKAITGEVVVERSAVYDLNHDGKPEVFGTIRKGRDPKNTPPERMQKSTAYINVWLSYANNQPTVIASQIEAYEIPVSRQPYDVLSVMDMNGDGIDEVIVRNVGYESFSFGIHQLQNNQLIPVFNGAGYGC